MDYNAFSLLIVIVIGLLLVIEKGDTRVGTVTVLEQAEARRQG